MKQALIFWFTGLSGSGKTTIADKAVSSLIKLGKNVKIFDGDVIRNGINKHLGFTPEDIKENNRIIVNLCAENKNFYDYIFVTIISPFEDSREYARKALGDLFYLIYCKVALEEVVRRDPKGLYKKAMTGQIGNFIGLDKNVPYQPPADADLILDTENEDIETSVNRLIAFINLLENKREI